MLAARAIVANVMQVQQRWGPPPDLALAPRHIRRRRHWRRPKPSWHGMCVRVVGVVRSMVCNGMAMSEGMGVGWGGGGGARKPGRVGVWGGVRV